MPNLRRCCELPILHSKPFDRSRVGSRKGRSKQHAGCIHSTASDEDRAARNIQIAPHRPRNWIHAARGGRALRTRSIGFRLSAWYFLVFASGIAAFSIAAWFAMRASLYHATDEALEDRVRGVQTFMEKQISSLSVPEIRDEFREHSVLGPGGDLFQVCDETGQLLYRSIPLETNNVPVPPPGEITGSRFETLTVQGHRLRFYSQRIAVNGKAYTVQVAAPVDEALEALERFRVILAF